MIKKCPNVAKETDQSRKHRIPVRNPPKHTVIKTAKIGDKEDMKISKGKATHYVQGNSHKAIS